MDSVPKASAATAWATLVAMRKYVERDSGEREVAAAAREFQETVAAAGEPARQPQRDDQLVVGERGGERAAEEVGRRDGAAAARTGDVDLGVAGERDRRQFRGDDLAAARPWL